MEHPGGESGRGWHRWDQTTKKKAGKKKKSGKSRVEFLEGDERGNGGWVFFHWTTAKPLWCVHKSLQKAGKCSCGKSRSGVSGQGRQKEPGGAAEWGGVAANALTSSALRLPLLPSSATARDQKIPLGSIPALLSDGAAPTAGLPKGTDPPESPPWPRNLRGSHRQGRGEAKAKF